MYKNSNSVGSVLERGSNEAIKSLAVVASGIVYIAGVLYSGVHNYNLMTQGVPADLLVFALLGLLALELTALILPVSLHFWCHAPTQRLAAMLFYGVTLTLIAGNILLDFMITAGVTIPAWLGVYQTYGVALTPIIVSIGWSIVYMLDPSERERAVINRVRASTREVLASRIAEAVNAATIDDTITYAGQQLARDITLDVLGMDKPKRRRVAGDSPPKPVAKSLPKTTEIETGELPPIPAQAVTGNNGSSSKKVERS